MGYNYLCIETKGELIIIHPYPTLLILFKYHIDHHHNIFPDSVTPHHTQVQARVVVGEDFAGYDLSIRRHVCELSLRLPPDTLARCVRGGVQSTRDAGGMLWDLTFKVSQALKKFCIGSP